jgi:ParB-like chromosome segregation protein Spo0J
VLRDGHHRVSVARDLGRDEIEAEVVELTTSRRTSSVRPAQPTTR